MTDERTPPTPDACWDDEPHDWDIATAADSTNIGVARRCRRCFYTSTDLIDLNHQDQA